MLQKKTTNILEKLPAKLAAQISQHLELFPELEPVFLEMYKRKKKALEKSDWNLLEQFLEDEETFVFNKL